MKRKRLARMTRRELGELEAELLRFKADRDELAEKMIPYGVTKMEHLDRRLTLVQATLAGKALAFDPKAQLPSRAEIALTVRDTRALLGLSQQGMADRMGCSFVTVSRWERGVLGMRKMTWQLLLKLAAEGRRE